MTKKIHHVLWLFSLSYKLEEIKKKDLLRANDGKKLVTEEIKNHNRNCLIITIILAILTGIFFDQNYYNNECFKWLTSLICFVIGYFVFSRSVEIFIAFLGDAVEKLNKTQSSSELNYGDRLRLAFCSYIELMIGFGVLYYILPSAYFKGACFSNIVEAIYFSGITMATVGYGDVSPAYFITQILVVFQVFCSLTLALVSFTVYTSLALSSPVCDRHGAGQVASEDHKPQISETK